MNVVFLRDSGSSRSWKKALVTSIFKTVFAPESLKVMSSSEGSIYLSLFTALFKYLKSVVSQMLPSFFSTRTIGEHQSAGSLIASMTPKSCSLETSSRTLPSKGMGMRRATGTEYG